MRRLACCILTVGMVWSGVEVASAQPVSPGELLGSTGSQGNSLISVDPGTGAGTLRCGLGEFGPVTEIEYRSDSTLFGSTGGGSSNIIVIDPENCNEVLVGEHPFGAVNGLEFVGDTLYGAFFAPQPGGEPEGSPPTFLVIVDQTDGSLTNLGEILEYSPVRGLAYDAATQTMYGVGAPILTEGVGDELFTIDLSDASTTLVGSTGTTLGSLEFGANGVLYGGGNSPGGPGEGGPSANLYTVSTTTGVATPVGPTGYPGVSGLAFVPGGRPVVAAIPTLSAVGTTLFLALLLGSAIVLMRRRAARA